MARRGAAAGFFVMLLATGDFTVAVIATFLLWLFLGAVRFVDRLVAEPGLLGFALVLFGVSWLFGGEDDDFGC